MISEETKQTLILSLLGLDNKQDQQSQNIDDTFLNQKVMVRTYSAGVHFGTLVAKQGQSAILKDSRRIYSWSGAATLSQLAMEGSKDIENCKITMTVKDLQLDRVIEVIPMTTVALDNLCGAIEWKK